MSALARAARSERRCSLCGHVITFARCGGGEAIGADGVHHYLCHADDHSCYHRWTVYGDRPEPAPHH